MIDDETWLRAVRRVTRPGRGSELEIDGRYSLNPATRQVRRNPDAHGVLVEAPPGATYRVGVRADGHRYALTESDARFVERIGLEPGSPVYVSFHEADQFATLQRDRTLGMHGLCAGCWKPMEGECACAAEVENNPVRPNPQLQVLGDYTRPNPMRSNVSAPPEIMSAVKRFHGSARGDLVSEFQSDDGKNEEVKLGYLGHVPAISWLSDEKGSAPKTIVVPGAGPDDPPDKVKFTGFRKLFRGQSQPVICLDVKTGEAVICQGTVESLIDRCDSRGVLGFSPVVEYIVKWKKDSSKGVYHYVHKFQKDYEPVLRVDQAASGLRFDRDRSLGVSGRKPSGFNSEAVYDVTDWFRERGFEGHH